MSIGMIVLLILGLLILFGVLDRVLDRMALTDRQALIVVAAMFIGGWLPDIPLGRVQINIGGALIPIIVSVYLLLNAGTAKERIRAVVAACLTAAGVSTERRSDRINRRSAFALRIGSVARRRFYAV